MSVRVCACCAPRCEQSVSVGLQVCTCPQCAGVCVLAHESGHCCVCRSVNRVGCEVGWGVLTAHKWGYTGICRCGVCGDVDV